MGRNLCVLCLTFALTIQTGSSHLLRPRAGHKTRVVTHHDHPTCAPLDNKGSHFTVEIDVGTPGQTFAVVADTGSDAIIVPSCICQKQGACDEHDRCFTGTNKSSTFLLKGFNSSELQEHQPKQLPVVNMVFGSGPVQAVIATDVVNVGGLRATMKNGVLLMVGHQLRMNGPFEGILGLGQPKNETEIRRLQEEQEKEMAAAEKKRQDDMEKMIGKSSTGDKESQPQKEMEEELKAIDRIIKQAVASGGGAPAVEHALAHIAQQHPHGLQALAMSTDSHPVSGLLDPISGLLDDQPSPFGKAITSHIPHPKLGHDAAGEQDAGKQIPIEIPNPSDAPDQSKQTKMTYKTKSFLQAANVKRFSMCFNDHGKEGALYLSPPKAKHTLASVGTVHWGLDFQGISVGNVSAPVKFCSPSSQEEFKDGQMTACGGIPDSGTTLFMGPENHIRSLFEGICDEWPRCRKAVSTGLGKLKSEVLMMLLKECGEWMNEEEGLDEMPALHFKVADGNGKKQTLSLDAAAYIIEQKVQEMKVVTKNFMGMPIKVPKKTGNFSKVCAPAFGPMDMNTKKNGPVWILGSPLFYKYTVGYDLDTERPSISFIEQSCGCSNDTALVSNGKGKKLAKQPRKLNGPPRVSHFDLSLGL